MLEPPSASLVKLLRELRLCTPADLRRCRSRVRRLAVDLPAFDSVWIDGLVQLRKVSPFQAQLLESSQPEQIRVGPCVLVDRLSLGSSRATYLARGIATGELRSLKLVDLDSEHLADSWARSQKLIAKSADFAHPLIVLPEALEKMGNRIVYVSRWVPGRTLTELLVRRGRYPAKIVWEIGRQLAEALSRLHSAGLVHGDIRPSKVRITAEGHAVLVDTGIQGVLEPELTPHSQLAPECYDCVAPELIGSGTTYSVASDLYSLGCLMWQLLAGRPPFPGGDPLAKLAAHQTKRIRDVRDLAPDTPATVAEMITRLTAPNVKDRPGSAGEVLKNWGLPRRSGRILLSQFVSSFDRPVGESTSFASLVNSPLTWLFALLFAVSGLTASSLHEGTRAHLLKIWAALPQSSTAGTGTSGAELITRSDANVLPPSQTTTLAGHTLPEPDARGVITLDTVGPYLATSIKRIGPLVIRSRPGITAELVIDDQPLFLLAEVVRLEGIHIRRRSLPEVDPDLKALVLVSSLELEVQDVLFQTISSRLTGPSGSLPPEAIRETENWPAAVCWKVSDPTNASAGRAVWTNVTIAGASAAFDLRSTFKQIVMKNVLRLGAGPLVDLAIPDVHLIDAELALEHVTLRDAGALLRWRVPEVKPGRQRIRILAQRSVMDCQPAAGGLLEIITDQFASQWIQRVQMEGDVCLLSERTEVSVQTSAMTGEIQPLDSANMELDGISQGVFSFLGSPSLQPHKNAIDSNYEGLRSTRGLPGIIADQLPLKGNISPQPPTARVTMGNSPIPRGTRRILKTSNRESSSNSKEN